MSARAGTGAVPATVIEQINNGQSQERVLA